MPARFALARLIHGPAVPLVEQPVVPEEPPVRVRDVVATARLRLVLAQHAAEELAACIGPTPIYDALCERFGVNPIAVAR